MRDEKNEGPVSQCAVLVAEVFHRPSERERESETARDRETRSWDVFFLTC